MGNRCAQEVKKYSWKKGEADLNKGLGTEGAQGCLLGLRQVSYIGDCGTAIKRLSLFVLRESKVTISLKHRLELECFMTIM